MSGCKISDLYVGQYYEKFYIVSEDMGLEFANISRDFNPIHLNSDVAKNSRFGKKIVHGMLIGSFFSGIIGNEFPGAGSIYISQDIKFRQPVYYGTKIRIRVEVSDVNMEKCHVVLKTQCYDDNNNILVDGNARILYE